MHIILWIMLAFLSLYVVRIIKGPSIWDRLLGLNLISTKIVLIIIIYASLQDTAYLLDFAIAYGILGFIGLMFTARFLLGRITGGKK